MSSRRSLIAIFCTVALFLQATVGFALSIQCLVDCSRPAPTSTGDCCAHKDKAPGNDTKHHDACKGCCGQVTGAKSAASTGLPQFLGISQVKLALLPHLIFDTNLVEIDAPEPLFCTDSSPPSSGPPDRVFGRAPPVN